MSPGLDTMHMKKLPTESQWRTREKVRQNLKFVSSALLVKSTMQNLEIYTVWTIEVDIRGGAP